MKTAKKTPLKPGKHRVSLRHEGGPQPVDLRAKSRIIPLPAHGAEDVIDGGAGTVLCGTENGAIYRVDIRSKRCEMLANTGGRPLGLELCADGSLIVCDSFAGLLRYRPSETGGTTGGFDPSPEVLATEVDGKQLKFCSNASEAPDGSIWFTESTDRFHYPEFMGAILEHSARGSLNQWLPDGTVRRVVDGRFFANGVVVEPDGSGVLFCETTDYAVRRFDVATGRVEDIATNLPGFPDNASALSGRDEVWIAYAHPRSKPLDSLAKLPSVLRHAAWNLPDSLRPGPGHDVWLTQWSYSPDDAHSPTASTTGRWELTRQIRGVHPQFHTATAAVRIGRELIVASKDHACLLAISVD